MCVVIERKIGVCVVGVACGVCFRRGVPDSPRHIPHLVEIAAGPYILAVTGGNGGVGRGCEVCVPR